MIVISGALVLVALVLLVIGIVAQELSFVYASIGVSLVSLVFLVIGILQRRGEPLPDGAAAAPTATVQDPAEATTALPVPVSVPVVADAAVAEQEEELEYGGTVLVVAGRPRYHVEGCRYLTGKQSQQLDVLDAREEGFTPCGVCRPDAALAELEAVDADETDDQTAVPAVADEVETDADELVEDDEVEVAPVPVRAGRTRAGSKTTAVAAPERAARPAARTAALQVPVEQAVPARGADKSDETAPAPSERAAAKASATKAPATKAPAAKVPAAKAPAAKVPAAKVPATKVPATKVPAAKAPAKKAPAKAAAPAGAAAPARKAPAASTGVATVAAPADEAVAPAKAPSRAAGRAGSVVVIPDRGRFHRADCRYVRGVDGAEVLSKAAATKQGYDACGVCKP